MARTSLSGFPSGSVGRIVEQAILDHIRSWVFELHGFAGIETERLKHPEQLQSKGETRKRSMF